MSHIKIHVKNTIFLYSNSSVLFEVMFVFSTHFLGARAAVNPLIVIIIIMSYYIYCLFVFYTYYYF